jgi:glycine oxidase
MRNHELFSSGETADAVIVGGGVIGLAIARSLARRGLGRITLVERTRLGSEASFAAAGMLAPQAEANGVDPFVELACAGRDMYSAFAEALLEETGTDVELERTGTLYLALTEEDEEEIERRYAWQRSAGLSVERLSAVEARSLEPAISPDVRCALRFPLDVQVENRRLLAALASAAQRYGVRIMLNTNVEAVTLDRERVSGVQTSRGYVSSPVAIIAGGAWSSSIPLPDSPPLRLRIEPVRGQMICFEANPRPARHVIYSPRGYIVPRLDGRLLAGSTTESVGFDKHVTGGGMQAISSHALEIAPLIAGLPVLDTWAGLRPRAEDDLPVLGACSQVPGLFYATGHYRNGILLAPITGELIGDAVAGMNPSPLLDAFTPDRWQYAAAMS